MVENGIVKMRTSISNQFFVALGSIVESIKIKILARPNMSCGKGRLWVISRGKVGSSDKSLLSPAYRVPCWAAREVVNGRV